MVDVHLSPVRVKGWVRLGFPGAVAALFASPMLWALGLFDGTAAPLPHAIIFGLSAMALFGVTPSLLGWALQGFAVRRKIGEEPDEHARGPAPVARAKVG